MAVDNSLTLHKYIDSLVLKSSSWPNYQQLAPALIDGIVPKICLLFFS